MLTLKQLKKDIQFNQELTGLIDVLKGIASAEFRHLQAKREYFMRFAQSLASFFKMVDLIKSKHPFLVPEQASLPCGIVMITSDEGFLGGLDSQVVNAGLSRRQGNDSLIILGERGARLLEEQKESFLYFPGITEDIEYAQAEGLRDYLIQQYQNLKLGKIIMVYPKFISFALQEVRAEQLLPYFRDDSGTPLQPKQRVSPLPCSKRSFEQAARDTLPIGWRGVPRGEILVEPSEGRIIDYLMRIWLVQRIYDIFWESKLSELASRVIHLEASSQILLELSKKLQFFYFRTVHQISDKNIREIIASRLIER